MAKGEKKERSFESSQKPAALGRLNKHKEDVHTSGAPLCAEEGEPNRKMEQER